MKYALLGDLHGHYQNTKKVLHHIDSVAPNAEIIGLGDLYECKIGKKKAAKLANVVALEQAVTIKKKFEQLLTFPSIIGNQEERIALVTGKKQFLQYAQEIQIPHATLIHGHQFQWDEFFNPTFPRFKTPLVFFGHSHRAAIYIHHVRTSIEYGVQYDVSNGDYIINVGAVCDTCDWCLYDSELLTVTFYQAL